MNREEFIEYLEDLKEQLGDLITAFEEGNEKEAGVIVRIKPESLLWWLDGKELSELNV